jgi:hypothetical protein
MTSFIPCQILQPSSHSASYKAAIQERALNASNNQSSRPKRNIGSHTKYWANGKTLKIAMYDASDEAIEAVRAAASAWLPYVNLKFEFIKGDIGDIRIFLNAPNMSQSSEIGTDALIDDIGGTDEERRGPSMFLTWKPGDRRFEYVVMHEFGHALGAQHAHQHPDSGIPWNVQNVYKLCAQKYGWDANTVDQNILPLPWSDQYSYEPYDGNSVMHYEIPYEWTFNWGQSESWAISDGDIAMMRKAYPMDEGQL